MDHFSIPLFYFVVSIFCQSDPWDEVPIILSRIIAPTFRPETFDIVAFGAIAAPDSDDVEAPYDTVRINSNAIRDAIRECSNSGGGTVIVPNGTFISGESSAFTDLAL